MRSEQFKDGSEVGFEALGEHGRRTTEIGPELARVRTAPVRLPVDEREALALGAEVPIVVLEAAG
jgi:hypothetical protein